VTEEIEEMIAGVVETAVVVVVAIEEVAAGKTNF
jgi:hypothetical protein